ncbi:FAD-dependent thymidylate synthase [Fervidicella metallireducens]|uniref:FAD-dependent thymidylate synthase n=1 Tax=Fervidicella metallireducens TaxID=655338 RepID=UPI000AE66652|nr:FAD-dependent thymidylate synthase [Fervidicella metallireducens]
METKLKVKLIAHTPEPEKIIASAAKLCYSRVGIDEIMENLNEENTQKFLNMLIDLGHESPIEHVNFTFAVEGVSRTLTHQLVRHRIASYSQQSQRYVKLEQFQYIVPPSIEMIPEAKELFIKAMEEDQNTYNTLVEILMEKHIKKLVEGGMEENKAKRVAEKMAIEDARYVFPNACETKIVFTMNARTLFNFLRHRCCNRAQWEIKNLADEMLKQLKEVAPTVFKNCGPGCISGSCPEGGMSCGKIQEVREKYKGI